MNKREYYDNQPPDDLGLEPGQGKRPDQVTFSAGVLMFVAFLLALLVIGFCLGLVIGDLTQ